MSIDKVNKYNDVSIYNLYIDVSIYVCYNGIMEGYRFILNAPSKNRTEEKILTVSKAQQKAVAKYNSKAYDRVELKVQKGSKADIQSHAEARSESLNGFINRAITETMERDNAKQQ